MDQNTLIRNIKLKIYVTIQNSKNITNYNDTM